MRENSVRVGELGRPQSSKSSAQVQPRRPTILIVDDEESFHRVVSQYLGDYRLIRAYTGWQAMEAVVRHHVDVALLDLNLPDANGLEILDQLRGERDDLMVIVMTAHSELKNALEAGRRGAFDFLAKSFETYQNLREHITRALDRRKFEREKLEASTRLQWLVEAYALLDRSKSSSMQAITRIARQVASTPLTVLIEGESGVGKGILARYIHAHSDRARPPLRRAQLRGGAARPARVASCSATCAAPSPAPSAPHVGQFELADGGTLFLDEIGELDAAVQAKLLRVLQERGSSRVGAHEPSPIDVRVIAATNKRPARRRSRPAASARTSSTASTSCAVPLPALRERREDVPDAGAPSWPQARAAPEARAGLFAAEALAVLSDYDWPGNVRELENLVMRLVAVHPGKTIDADDIPPEYCLPTLNELANRDLERSQRDGAERRPYFLAREQFERYLVRLTVQRCNGDKRAAARALGVGYSTVKEKMRDESSRAGRPDSESE